MKRAKLFSGLIQQEQLVLKSAGFDFDYLIRSKTPSLSFRHSPSLVKNGFDVA
jgi:hypothetical protein